MSFNATTLHENYPSFVVIRINSWLFSGQVEVDITS
jgi:hypothetical protein